MIYSEQNAAVAHEDLCRFIAACFYEPEPAFEEEGMFGSLLEAAKAVDEKLVPLAHKLGVAFRNTRIDDLLLDYTRLFLGPMNILAKPYGSVWLDEDKTLMGDSTMAVLELYREADFEMDEEFKELPDHIAVELEFLYLLIFQENEVRSSSDAERLEAVTDLKTRFLDQHLSLWIVPFSSAVKKNAESIFYRQLAELTELFVRLEIGQ